MKDKKRLILKILKILVIIIVIVALAVLLFLKFWPALGGTATAQEQEDYQRRADNYRDGIFYNEEEFTIIEEVAENETDALLSTKGELPADPIPTKTPQFLENPAPDDLTVTWFGHSALLIQMHGMNILIDPMLGEWASPVTFAGSKRFSQPGITPEELPRIDILLMSHDHYDHLDYQTIRTIDDKVDRYLVPLGVENHLERFGVAADKIQNMAWWEEQEIAGLTIACTPARHYSGRSLNDQYKTLWASWVLIDDNHKVFESGDSGYGSHFAAIHERYGDFDLALVDSAQYDLRWPSVHMNPEESTEAAKTVGAAQVIPIHWAAFQLANHPWDDPAERFIQAHAEVEDQVLTPRIGETLIIDGTNTTERWWQTVN